MAKVGSGKVRSSQGSSRPNSYADSGVEENDPKKLAKEVKRQKQAAIRRKTRVAPESSVRRGAMADGNEGSNRGSSKKNNLRVDTTAVAESAAPRTPANARGSRDLRSPGVQKTPIATSKSSVDQALPDFITQTDANGNASTPRSSKAIEGARQIHPTGPKPHLHVDKNGKLKEEEDDDSNKDLLALDPCESLLDGLRMMCCCLMPEETTKKIVMGGTQDSSLADKIDRVRLLGALHPEDTGKKCLVLDLDETLVHSSFRAVPGADFVIPVQIEDVVHFVYVAKRPGVDEFLIEMAKHYEIVIYTASLNKYADPLLDLLDPNRVIRARLFRESCVYYEGNYVKDLSLLDRDLSKSIIIDNSPSSYMFHPENAIDCSSFIDDPRDRELDQMGAFLAGIKDIKDVRGVCPQWREWPNISVPEDQR